VSRRRKPKKWDPVVVRWLDAFTDYEPRSSAEYLAQHKPCHRATIGWYVGEDEDHVIIAMEDDRKANVPGRDCEVVTSIPHGMVLGDIIILDMPDEG
jgi:hypothetical protein